MEGKRQSIFTVIPCWEIKDEASFKSTIFKTFENILQGSFPFDFHIRELEDMDLGLDHWKLPSNQAINYSGTTWVNHPLSTYEAVMIYGVSSSFDVLAVRKLVFKQGIYGHTIIGRNDLSELKTLEPALQAIKECKKQEWLIDTFGGSAFNLRMEGYFREPYIYRSQEIINIGVIYAADREPAELKLMGYIAEAVGKNIA